jgi:hypothetical protein
MNERSEDSQEPKAPTNLPGLLEPKYVSLPRNGLSTLHSIRSHGIYLESSCVLGLKSGPAAKGAAG